MRKSLLIIGLFLTLILAGWASNSTSDGVAVSPSTYDFGDIAQSEGVVSTTFTIVNTSKSEIVINRLSTSCGCTTAKMDESPLKPGESRTMTVTFDPMVHPDQFGRIERVVYLQTSDPGQPEIEINITGNITP